MRSQNSFTASLVLHQALSAFVLRRRLTQLTSPAGTHPSETVRAGCSGWKRPAPGHGRLSRCLATSSGHSLPSNSISPRASRRWSRCWPASLTNPGRSHQLDFRDCSRVLTPSPGQTRPPGTVSASPAAAVTIRTPETATHKEPTTTQNNGWQPWKTVSFGRCITPFFSVKRNQSEGWRID